MSHPKLPFYVKLKHKGTSFHDPDTRLAVSESHIGYVDKTVGKRTSAAIMAGGLVVVKEGDPAINEFKARKAKADAAKQKAIKTAAETAGRASTAMAKKAAHGGGDVTAMPGQFDGSEDEEEATDENQADPLGEHDDDDEEEEESEEGESEESEDDSKEQSLEDVLNASDKPKAVVKKTVVKSTSK